MLTAALRMHSHVQADPQAQLLARCFLEDAGMEVLRQGRQAFSVRAHPVLFVRLLGQDVPSHQPASHLFLSIAQPIPLSTWFDALDVTPAPENFASPPSER